MNKNNTSKLRFLNPSIVMAIITILSSTDLLSTMFGVTEVDLKGLMIIGLVAIFPITILIDGIIVAIKNKNWILPLITSLTTFIIIMLIYLNSSASIYLIYYTTAYFLGFIPTKLILKLKKSKVK